MAMTRAFLVVGLCCGLGAAVAAHNIGATPVTWNREISRLVYDRCASCHRPGGTAFSMMTYTDVQPRLVAIKTAVLSRTMPPWGAIKGFGEFRNDQALTQEQIELFTLWVANDTPRGNNRRALPKEPTPAVAQSASARSRRSLGGGGFTDPPAVVVPPGAIAITGTTTLDRPLVLDGVSPVHIRPDQSARIVAVLPGGRTRPLVWLHGYDERMPHLFLYRDVVALPKGTVIQGIPPGIALSLIPASK
jgi:mono/diheme cytochrome c family protein